MFGRGFYLALAIVGGLIAYYFWPGPFDPDAIKGKRVVITGCSTGIGEQLAYHYSQLGARILITARRGNVLQEVVNKCKELGAEEALFIPLDMSNLNDTVTLIEEAKSKLGGLDHLVMNHVAGSFLELWSGDFDRLQKIFDVNFRAYVSLATNAMPMLKESRGSIGVVSSIAGKVGIPFAAIYSSTKFALGGFFSAYRQELEMQGIDVSISEFVIGSINTPNAIKYSQRVFDSRLFSTSAEDTAYRIMTGVQRRERTVYFPIYAFPSVVLRDVTPKLLEYIITSTINAGAIPSKKDSEKR